MSYIVSPFNPVFWKPTTDKFGAKSKYVQQWAPTDTILVQCIQLSSSAPITGIDGNVPTLTLKNVETGATQALTWQSWDMNTWATVKWCTLTALSPGIYSLLLGTEESEPFCVTTVTDYLERTSLIQYSMVDNRRRMDTAFVIDGDRVFFDFRVPGGFMDNGWAFGVDNEQFMTSLYDSVDVHSHELLQKNFTLGGSEGVPVWFAELLNSILTCSYVYIDGVRYTRHESDVPEIVNEMEDLRSYIFTQTVQKVKYLQTDVEEANMLSLRRVGSVQDDFRVTTQNNETMNRMV